MAVYINEDAQSMAQARRYQIRDALARMDGETATDVITAYWGRCLLEEEGFYFYLVGSGYIDTNKQQTYNYNQYGN